MLVAGRIDHRRRRATGRSPEDRRLWHLRGDAVFLCAVSTLYHSLRGRAKRFFRRLDHYSIYVLIAGTDTPFTLRDGCCWTIIWRDLGLDGFGDARGIVAAGR
ncbi:MAG: hemolysin III family protein [Candidatus Competibacter sp.]